MRLRILFLALLISLPLSAAHAGPEPFPKTLKYRIAWNGIKIGRVNIDTSQTQYSYKMTLDTKTTGIAKMFSPLKSITWASGRFYEGNIVPQKYSARSTSDEGKNRTALLTYDESGMLLERKTDPTDDPNWRPVVPVAEVEDAYDPVTAFFVLRQKLFANVNAHITDTPIKTYDGRRLAEFNFKAVNTGTRMRDNTLVKVVNTVVTRKPINGYTPKELKKFDEGDPKVHVYFSADPRFVPIEIEIYHWSGKITGSLEE